jgi:uncharacterized protein with WD repeat
MHVKEHKGYLSNNDTKKFGAFPKAPAAKPWSKQAETKSKGNTNKNQTKKKKKIERNEKQRTELKQVLAKIDKTEAMDKIKKHLETCDADASDILVLARIFLDKPVKKE